MAVAHNPAGFTGTVDQIDEARRFALNGGGRFRVNTSADWAVSANSGVNRSVNIAVGGAAACGVYDATTAIDTVAFAANSGGSDRLDVVVASFDWSTMAVSFRVVQGTTVLPAIVRTGATVDLTKINWLPGIRYDAVLGVIRARPGVAILAPADLYDCRLWGSWAVGNVVSATYRDAIDVDAGGRIRETDGTIWSKKVDGTWEGYGAGGWVTLLDNSSYSASIPVTGTPTTLPSTSYTSPVVPVGKTLEVEFHAPYWSAASATNAYLRMVLNGAVVTGGDISTATGTGFHFPTTLSGSVSGAGATVSILMQAWASSGASDVGGSPTSGVGVRMRYRIS